MSGDHSPIQLEAGTDSVLARAVEALSRFPTDEPWVLVGGITVFIRLGSVTRPTADAVVDATIPVASTSGLVALKTVSMARRPHGNSSHKVASDIHDLVRLVADSGACAVASALVTEIELVAWVATRSAGPSAVICW